MGLFAPGGESAGSRLYLQTRDGVLRQLRVGVEGGAASGGGCGTGLREVASARTGNLGFCRAVGLGWCGHGAGGATNTGSSCTGGHDAILSPLAKPEEVGVFDFRAPAGAPSSAPSATAARLSRPSAVFAEPSLGACMALACTGTPAAGLAGSAGESRSNASLFLGGYESGAVAVCVVKHEVFFLSHFPRNLGFQ